MSITNTSGRRKTAVARAYVADGNGAVIINSKDYKVYFTTLHLQYIVTQSLEVAEATGKFDIKINVKGGGIKGQAEAVRLAIAKALVEIDHESKPAQRDKELLTRDYRMVQDKTKGKNGRKQEKER